MSKRVVKLWWVMAVMAIYETDYKQLYNPVFSR